MADFDAIFVGSGINSLVGAALLARAGWEVCVLERNSTLGGNLCSEELTAPGYLHDVLAGWHPLFLGSAAYRELAPDLEAAGLEYLNTHYPSASLTSSGQSIFLSMSQEENIREFDRFAEGDGSAWDRIFNDFLEEAGVAFGLLQKELWSQEGLFFLWRALRDFGTRGSLDFGSRLLLSCRDWLGENFQSRESGALLAPWVLHAGLGPDAAGSGFMAKLMAAAFQMGGMPVPRGGSVSLARALRKVIEAHGGQLETGQQVSRILLRDGQAVGVRTSQGREVSSSRAVICSVTPQQLYLDLLKGIELPTEVLDQARRFRFGRADMQIHLALSEPPEWPLDQERFLQTAIVHLADDVDSVSRAVNEANRGLLPARATVVVGQPMSMDSSRGPEGCWILWIQLQELPREPRGDARGEIECGGQWTPALAGTYSERILERLGEQIPNLRRSIVGQAVLSPKDLEKRNVNLVGGDPYSGACDLDQFFLFRPLAGYSNHETPVGQLFHIGASTHPGPGLHGASGFLVAQKLLRRRLPWNLG